MDWLFTPFTQIKTLYDQNTPTPTLTPTSISPPKIVIIDDEPIEHPLQVNREKTWAEKLWEEYTASKQIEELVKEDLKGVCMESWFQDVSSTRARDMLKGCSPGTFMVLPRIMGISLWWMNPDSKLKEVVFNRVPDGYRRPDSEYIFDDIANIIKIYRSADKLVDDLVYNY